MLFNKVEIRDPAVNNIVGATVLVPDDWRLDGGFVWMPLFSMQANLLVRVSDPHTGAGVETLPSQQFCWPLQPMPMMQPGANWMGSVMLPPPQSPVEFLQMFYLPGPLRHLQSARLVRGDDMPQLAREVARSIPPDITPRVARLRYAYEYGGGAWEEDIYLTLTFAQPNGWTAMWWCSGNAMRAPAGQLDRTTRVLLSSLNSLRLTFEWSAMLDYVKHLYRQNLRGWQEDIRQLGQMYLQYFHEAQRMHQQVWQERQASQDRQNFAFREALGGVETFYDPYEARSVELPVGYQAHWVNNKGQILVHDDPTFDPRPGSTEDWRDMRRYQPYG